MIIGLVIRAIAGELRHAEEGKLPPFVVTLGLPQTDLRVMMERCFPGCKYAAAGSVVPQTFTDLDALIFSHRAEDREEQLADWLARAIAAASFGGRHLWQDLGVSGRDEVSLLLDTYFPSLYRRNTNDLKWKKFLYVELGEHLGSPGIQAPKCHHCDQFRICYPAGGNTEANDGYQRQGD